MGIGGMQLYGANSNAYYSLIFLVLSLFALSQCYQSCFPNGTNKEDLKKDDVTGNLTKGGLKWLKIYAIIQITLGCLSAVAFCQMPDKNDLWTDKTGSKDVEYKRWSTDAATKSPFLDTMTQMIGCRQLALHMAGIWALMFDGYQLRFLGGYMLSLLFLLVRDTLCFILVDKDQFETVWWAVMLALHVIVLGVHMMGMMKLHKYVEEGVKASKAVVAQGDQ